MNVSLDMVLAALGRAVDKATADRILERNLPLFPNHAEHLRAAYLRRFSDIYSGSTLMQDIWASMEVMCRILGTKFNPDCKSFRSMPAMLARHQNREAEAIAKTIHKKGGTLFFQKCVKAGTLRFTNEAICLRHPENFSEETRRIAAARLDQYPHLPR